MPIGIPALAALATGGAKAATGAKLATLLGSSIVGGLSGGLEAGVKNKVGRFVGGRATPYIGAQPTAYIGAQREALQRGELAARAAQGRADRQFQLGLMREQQSHEMNLQRLRGQQAMDEISHRVTEQSRLAQELAQTGADRPSVLRGVGDAIWGTGEYAIRNQDRFFDTINNWRFPTMVPYQSIPIVPR